jgi:sporulation protein YlmC with PRC-barrel domain
MSTHASRWVLAAACCTSLLLANAVMAQQAPQQTTAPPQKQASTQAGGAHVTAAKVFRTSNLNGMEVKNSQGQSLGKIEELVIDVSTGKVAYAALSFGGVLGIGDKLFAVPWEQLTLKHGEDETHFVLDINKEKLAAAPGFNKDKWPDFANANWMQEINRYYQREQRQAETPTTTTPRR